MDLSLDPGKTALVAIDLQKGILANPSGPNGGAIVVANVARMAEALRAKGGFVVLVHVGPLDGGDALHPVTDNPPNRWTPGPDWVDIDPSLLPHASLIIRKRQWGAFYGTELDLQLRRRGIDTIVLCGISTSMGVESTARDAFERGYNQVFVEDAMSAMTAEEHANVVKTTFPRLGRIRTTEDVLGALK